MKFRMFLRRLALTIAAFALLGAVHCFAAEPPVSQGEATTTCTVENCPHTADSACPAFAAPTFTYDGAAAPHGSGYYYSQLENALAQKAIDAIDACFNPNGSDIPVPRLGVIEVTSLPAGLTEADLNAIHQQTVDILCIDRPQYFWLDKNFLRFGLKSSAQGSVLVMDLSDRLLNVYHAWTEVRAEGEAAEAAARKALALLEGVQGDTARLRTLHDFILDNTEYTYEIEQAYSFTGALVHGRAICEGYAKTFQLLARRAGYACELVVGYGIRPDGSSELHMWNSVSVGGSWYMVDCTWDDSKTLAQGDRYRYFLLDAAQAAQRADHVEDGNINLKTLADKRTPKPEVKVFAFPRLSSVPLVK